MNNWNKIYKQDNKQTRTYKTTKQQKPQQSVNNAPKISAYVIKRKFTKMYNGKGKNLCWANSVCHFISHMILLCSYLHSYYLRVR